MHDGGKAFSSTFSSAPVELSEIVESLIKKLSLLALTTINTAEMTNGPHFSYQTGVAQFPYYKHIYIYLAAHTVPFNLHNRDIKIVGNYSVS